MTSQSYVTHLTIELAVTIYSLQNSRAYQEARQPCDRRHLPIKSFWMDLAALRMSILKKTSSNTLDTATLKPRLRATRSISWYCKEMSCDSLGSKAMPTTRSCTASPEPIWRKLRWMRFLIQSQNLLLVHAREQILRGREVTLSKRTKRTLMISKTVRASTR